MTLGHGDYVFEIRPATLDAAEPWRARPKYRGWWQGKLVGCRRATEPYGDVFVRPTRAHVIRECRQWAESLAAIDRYLRGR